MTNASKPAINYYPPVSILKTHKNLLKRYASLSEKEAYRLLSALYGFLNWQVFLQHIETNKTPPFQSSGLLGLPYGRLDTERKKLQEILTNLTDIELSELDWLDNSNFTVSNAIISRNVDFLSNKSVELFLYNFLEGSESLSDYVECRDNNFLNMTKVSPNRFSVSDHFFGIYCYVYFHINEKNIYFTFRELDIDVSTNNETIIFHLIHAFINFQKEILLKEYDSVSFRVKKINNDVFYLNNDLLELWKEKGWELSHDFEHKETYFALIS